MPKGEKVRKNKMATQFQMYPGLDPTHGSSVLGSPRDGTTTNTLAPSARNQGPRPSSDHQTESTTLTGHMLRAVGINHFFMTLLTWEDPYLSPNSDFEEKESATR